MRLPDISNIHIYIYGEQPAVAKIHCNNVTNLFSFLSLYCHHFYPSYVLLCFFNLAKVEPSIWVGHSPRIVVRHRRMILHSEKISVRRNKSGKRSKAILVLSWLPLMFTKRSPSCAGLVHRRCRARREPPWGSLELQRTSWRRAGGNIPGTNLYELAIVLGSLWD